VPGIETVECQDHAGGDAALEASQRNAAGPAEHLRKQTVGGSRTACVMGLNEAQRRVIGIRDRCDLNNSLFEWELCLYQAELTLC
jgi:hypothetical protein